MEDSAGILVTCQHAEAMACFNKGMEAYVSLRENPVPWFQAALKIDSNLVVAHSLLGYFLMFSLHPPTDPNVIEHLEAVKKVEKSSLYGREVALVRSFQAYASGNLQEALEILLASLADQPLDALMVHVMVRSCIMLGEFEKMRDTMAWVLAFWQEDKDFYPYLLAFYSYALEECNQREKAETLARRALDINAVTPFAYHAMSHVMEEVKEASEGIIFLTTSRDNWITSMYRVHLTWHLCLYYLDLGDTESVLREFDGVILDKVLPDNMMGMLDASSLLWRLNLVGVDPGEERWGKVMDAVAVHISNHQSPWFTTHIMMALARGKASESAARLSLARAMLQSLDDFVQESGGVLTRKKTYEKLGIPVCNALLAFGKGKYEEVLQIMLPLKHNLVQVGGSWAQRQIFNITMIEAAVQAKNLPIAIGLVAELQARKPYNHNLKLLLQKLKEEYKEMTDPQPNN